MAASERRTTPGDGPVAVALLIGSIDGRLTPSDRAAAALAVTRFSPDEVICHTGGDEAALRYALAAGCSRSIAVLDDVCANVYLLGRGAAGIDADAFAAELACRRDATLVLDVLTVDVRQRQLCVERDLGRGARERLTIEGPVVLLVSDQAAATRYVSRYRQGSVQLPAEFSPATPMPTGGPWSPVRTRTRTAEFKQKTSGDAQSRMFGAFGLAEPDSVVEQGAIVADAETCARRLVRYLAHHGFIAAGLQGADPDATPSTPVARQPTFATSSLTAAPSSGPATRAPRRLGGPRRTRHVLPLRRSTSQSAPATSARAPRPLGKDRRQALTRRPRLVTSIAGTSRSS